MNDSATQDRLLKTKPFDPIETMTRHWLKVVVFGGVLFFLLSPAVFFKSKPYYQTTGKLRVSPVTPAFMSRNEETSITSYYTGFVQTQVDRIKNPRLIEKAIERLPSDIKKHFIGGGDIPLSLAARIVERKLEVAYLKGTHLIEVKFSRGSPEGIAELVNMLMREYIDEYEREEVSKDNVRLSSLLKEKERVESEIIKQTENLKKYSEDITVSAFYPDSDQLNQFQAAYEKAYREKIEKENHLKSIIDEGKALQQLSLDAYVNDLVENSSLVSQLDIFAQKSYQELRNSRIGMAKDNPEWKMVDEKINDINEYTEEQRNLLREKINRLLTEKRETELQEKIIQARAEYQAAKNIEEDILKKRNEILNERRKIFPKILYRDQIETNLAQLRNQLNKIESRFNELKLESNASGRIILETRAERPDSPAGNNMMKLLVLLFIFSMGSIAGICIVFDLLDERIRTIKDVVNVIGASPHRPIPDYLLTNKKNLSFSRVTIDDPSNKVARSFYSLAIRLDKDRRERKAKIAVFTGVDSRSGVTEILLNTAHAMSRLCGKVLVIEANINNPVLEKLTETNEKRKGLVDILIGEAELTECIYNDRERKIDLLLAGHLPSESELVMMERSKIPPLLKVLKNEYDFIMIDSVPMLVNDLTEFLLVQADIASLIIQGDRSIYRHTYTAGQLLINLEVPAVAVVLNWGAPRYRTRVQEMVYNMMGPIQKRIRSILSRYLYPAPAQPYSLPDTTGQTGQIAEPFSRPAIVHEFDGPKIQKAAKSTGILCLILIVTLVTSSLISSKEKLDAPDKSIVRQIIEPSEEINGTHSEDQRISKLDEEYADLVNKGSDQNKIPAEGFSEPIKKGPLTSFHDKRSSVLNDPIKNEEWILNQDPKLYTIQLLGSVDRQLLLDFARTHGLKDNVAYFHKIHKGRDWYTLIYGLYGGWSNALKDLKNLPDELTGSSPWIQSIDSIQKSIRFNDSLAVAESEYGKARTLKGMNRQ